MVVVSLPDADEDLAPEILSPGAVSPGAVSPGVTFRNGTGERCSARRAVIKYRIKALRENSGTKLAVRVCSARVWKALQDAEILGSTVIRALL